jgi:hypothetical protein
LIEIKTWQARRPGITVVEINTVLKTPQSTPKLALRLFLSMASLLSLLVIMMLAYQGQIAAQSTVVTHNQASAGNSTVDATTLPTGFYVATNGNDNNPGTLSEPFQTLARAQKAMKASSSVKTTYVRAGTYKPAVGKGCNFGAGASIYLTASDEGETWSYYPPDGYDSAIINGQSSVGNSGGNGGNGTGCAFSSSSVSNITIVGLQFENYLYSVFSADAGTNLKFVDNVVHNVTAARWGAGAVAAVCAPGIQIKNNYMYNLAYAGMELETNSTCPNGISNDLLSGNVIINSCTWPAVYDFGNDQNGGDCGAVYMYDQSSSSTNIQVVNNYIRDVNAASKGAADYGKNGQNGCCAQAVYLDTGTHNVTIKGNIFAGMMSACAQLNYPENVAITGNICDLAADSDYQSIVIYGRGKDNPTSMLGNTFEHNIVISSGNSTGYGYYGATKTPNPMNITDNVYHNYVGSTIKSTGNWAVGSDSNPVHENPQLSGWTYGIASGSAALDTPTSFAKIAGGWGPPGFVIPHTGTAPSCPH